MVYATLDGPALQRWNTALNIDIVASLTWPPPIRSEFSRKGVPCASEVDLQLSVSTPQDEEASQVLPVGWMSGYTVPT
jgi:hypothetical protein